MPTRKRKRKKVDPNAPARPASAYTLYMAKFRQKIIDKNGFRQSDIASIGRELGRTWKSLTAKQRHPYEKKAQKQSQTTNYSQTAPERFRMVFL